MNRASVNRPPTRRNTAPAPAASPSNVVPDWQIVAFAIVAFALAIWAYSPALQGEFVFDDFHLPVMQQSAIAIPLKNFLGLRPFVMFTYWANLHTFGLDPFAYHIVNLTFHFGASVFLYFIVRKILQIAQVAEPVAAPLSILMTSVFLLHPMQTEAVSYVAQRAESLGALFFFAAWTLFLYRRQAAVSWRVALGILALYGAAVGTKEHTVVLPTVLLLSDYFFGTEPRSFQNIRRNWRLYLPIAAGGLLAAILVFSYLRRDPTSIGFNLKEFTWYQYFFTEWRAFYFYLISFLFPFWQNIDHDFGVSHSPFEHGAVFALLGILTLVAAALYFRRRFPLASFGMLFFILVLLPTSSVIPIKDVLADRRFYLPMVGLLFVSAELLRHYRNTRILTGIVMVILAIGTFARNQAWGSQLDLWRDAAEKSPNKPRVQFGLAVSEFKANHCHDSIAHYLRATELEKPDYTVLMDLALAYECDNQPEKAIETMRASLREKKSPQALASLGVLYARQSKVDEALDALYQAQVIDASYAPIYFYRSKILIATEKWKDAEWNLQMLLGLDPGNESARQALENVQRHLR